MVPKLERRSADFFADLDRAPIERDGSEAHAIEAHELVRFSRNEMGPAAASRAHDHAGLCLSG